MTMPTSDSPFVIRTIADARRALATPGVVVWIERNDLQGPLASREPARRARMEAPRSVAKVSSSGAQLLIAGAERPYTMDFPKAADFRADGGNTFSVVHERDGDKELVVTYRVEHAGSEGAKRPSDPMRHYGVVSAEQVAAEEAELAMERAREEAERTAWQERLAERRAQGQPPADPRYAAFEAAVRRAVEAGLDAGIFYNDAMDAFVRERLGEAEFACREVLPDFEIPAGFWEKQMAEIDARRALAATPRGTLQRFVTRLSDGRVFADVMMSLGDGDVYGLRENAIQGERFECVYLHCLGWLVYNVRKKVEAERTARTNREAAAGIRVGATYQGLWVSGEKFTSATVARIDEAGTVHFVEMKKRGSRNRWTGSLPASALAAQVREGGAQLAESRLVDKAEDATAGSLF